MQVARLRQTAALELIASFAIRSLEVERAALGRESLFTVATATDARLD